MTDRLTDADAELVEAMAEALYGLPWNRMTDMQRRVKRGEARHVLAALRSHLGDRYLGRDGIVEAGEVVSITWPLAVVDHHRPDPSDPSLNYVTTVDLSDTDPDAFDLVVLRPVRPEEGTDG